MPLTLPDTLLTCEPAAEIPATDDRRTLFLWGAQERAAGEDCRDKLSRIRELQAAESETRPRGAALRRLLLRRNKASPLREAFYYKQRVRARDEMRLLAGIMFMQLIARPTLTELLTGYIFTPRKEVTGLVRFPLLRPRG